MPENKVKYGLKNAHYAVQTEANGVYSFGTPVVIPGAVNLTLNPVGDPIEFYADDGLFYGEEVNNGYDGTLEMALVPESFEKDVLGQELDDKGILIEKSSQKASPFALLFEFAADQNAIRHVLYNCSAARPKKEGTTKGEKKEIKTESLEFKNRPIPGTEEVKAKSSATADPTTYANWYAAVHRENKTFVPVTAISVAGAGGVSTLAEGATLAMIATITPTNASDPRIVWSVATLAGGVATINPQTGVLTATTDGTVTVTATNEASGVTGTKVITITNP